MLGLENVSLYSDAGRALRGFRLLQVLDRRGRRLGTRLYTINEFGHEYPIVYAAIKERQENIGEHVTQYHVAVAMGLSRSRFTDYLREYGQPWPPIEQIE